ncbi:unnamed protein product [Sphagnum balticum]
MARCNLLLISWSSYLCCSPRSLRFQWWPSLQEEAIKQYQGIMAQQEQAVKNLNIPGISEELTKVSYESTNKKIQNASNVNQESFAKSEQLSKVASNLSNYTDGLIANGNELNNKSEVGAKALEQSGKVTAAYIQEQNQKYLANLPNQSSSSDDCSVSWIPLLGDLICELWNGITSIIKYILGIIVFCIAICLIGLCVQSGCCSVFCKCLCRACSPTRHSFKHSYGSDSDEDDEGKEDEKDHEARQIHSHHKPKPEKGSTTELEPVATQPKTGGRAHKTLYVDPLEDF